MTLPDWQLVLSGPSAARWPISDAAKVATVNGSIALLGDRPSDAYGVFELTAANSYRQEIKNSIRKGTRVYMRPRCMSRCGQAESPEKLNLVDTKWGPESLRHLHDDVVWCAVQPEQDFGQARAWIGSGVLMLWILAETDRPDRVYISGLDTYPEHTKDEDYAEGIDKINDLDTLPEWRERRKQMNKRALQGLREITKHYRDTDFVFLEEPSFSLEGMNARVASADDLRRLYRGVEDKE